MFLPRATQCAIISNLAERTDIICKEFIKNGTWPFLSLEEAFCVRCRLENAYRLANALLIAQGTKIDVVIRPPDLAITPTEQVWKFFLFDWWHANATKYTVVDA